MAATSDNDVFNSLTLETLQGESRRMAEFAGQVVLVVNTASACGFTPQFKGLQSLHEQYAQRGLVILGFPCNQFGAQDPGTAQQISSFCETHYGVGFPMMAKTEVNGPQAHPLFQWLKKEAPGLLGSESIKWNFTKFLIARNGQVLGRFAPQDTPESMKKDIEAALVASQTHPSQS
jgi:glutathione peroxidase